MALEMGPLGERPDMALYGPFLLCRSRGDERDDDMTREMTGAEMVIQALADQGVEHLFGYPGGAVLPIYDAIFAQNQVRTSWCGTSRARCMPRKAMRARPARSAACWSPPAPARPMRSPD